MKAYTHLILMYQYFNKYWMHCCLHCRAFIEPTIKQWSELVCICTNWSLYRKHDSAVWSGRSRIFN